MEFVEAELFKYLLESVDDCAIFALDTLGCITTWNDAAERSKGYHRDEIIGTHFGIFYSPEELAENIPQQDLDRALKNGSVSSDGWRVRKDGSRFWARAKITALYDDQKQHIGFVKVIHDLTAVKHAEDEYERVENSRAQLEQNFNHFSSAAKDCAVFSLDPEGRIVSWNKGAEDLCGYTEQEIMGRNYSLFFPEDEIANAGPASQLAKALEPGGFEHEAWRLRKDGSQYWANIKISALPDGKGFIKFTRDLSERRKLESDLEKAREAVDLITKTKSQLIANVSHEIRTPLSGVIGLCELIATDSSLDAEMHEIAVRGFEASKQLLTILNDILDYAKLEAGKVEIVQVPYSVKAVIQDVIGLCRMQADDKKLSLTMQVESTVADPAIGDPGRLRQVLLNLVSNAIKFTRSGGVEIAVDQRNAHINFSVTDTGIGIKPQAQKKLFKPFSQCHDQGSEDFGGTGLGLSITRQYVRLMGGEIVLISESGKGTSVCFNLPVNNVRS